METTLNGASHARIRVPLLELGVVHITSSADKILETKDILRALLRHIKCDWGEIDEHDRGVNQAALANGERVLSVYTGNGGITFWIVTEGDRTSTTILLPEDY